MIFGIGIDIIEIDRIKKSIEKFGDVFLNKIFTATEVEYCLSASKNFCRFPESLTFGIPEASLKISISFHLKPLLQPVANAFDIASFAANLAAKC